MLTGWDSKTNAKICRNLSQCRGFVLHYRESRSGRHRLQFCQKHDVLVAKNLLATKKKKKKKFRSHRIYLNRTLTKISKIDLRLTNREVVQVKSSSYSSYDFNGKQSYHTELTLKMRLSIYTCPKEIKIAPLWILLGY